MALSETLKDLTEGIASLRNQTYELGDRYMQGENIMRDGLNLRDMLKNMDIEITKLEGTSRKDNPSVYDVEVEQYTSDEAGKLKDRLGELLNATSDFDMARGMFDGGSLDTGVVGGPVSVEILNEPVTSADIIKQDYSDPMLRLISGQRAGFYPHLGFGTDPYADVFSQALYGTPTTTTDDTTTPVTTDDTTTPVTTDDTTGTEVTDTTGTGGTDGTAGTGGTAGVDAASWASTGLGSLGDIATPVVGSTVDGTAGTGFGDFFGGVGDFFGGIGDKVGDFAGGIGDLFGGLGDSIAGSGAGGKLLGFIFGGPLGMLLVEYLQGLEDGDTENIGDTPGEGVSQ